jgi:outer membrane protein OmpA-like peptidoglycan-associated protein
VTGAGRDMLGLLRTIAAEARSTTGQTEVYLRTLGLPTVDPADVRVLMATDPQPAAASVKRALPDLHGIRLHLILAPPTGAQTKLNIRTADWRRKFAGELLRQAGADVRSVEEDNTVGSAAADASRTPVVPNLPDPTREPPGKPKPRRPDTGDKAVLDSAALFAADTADFTASEAAVRAQLQPIIDHWRQGAYSRVAVVGRCARFGPAELARRLSAERAERVAVLLRRAGVTDVNTQGLGHDHPLPGTDPQDPANRVVTVKGIKGEKK